MVNIDIRKAGEEMQSLFCMKKRQEFWEILDAARAEADCKSSPLFGVSTCILEILSVCGIIILIDYAKRKKYHKTAKRR